MSLRFSHSSVRNTFTFLSLYIHIYIYIYHVFTEKVFCFPLRHHLFLIKFIVLQLHHGTSLIKLTNITSLHYHYYTCPLIKVTNITSLHYNYHMCSILTLHCSNIISHYPVSIHLLIPSKIQLLHLPSIFCTRSKISLMFHL